MMALLGQRENTAGGIVHPEVVDGRGIWLDPEVQDILDKIQQGDPALGWEGDPRLALYRSEDGRWELWRLEHDDVMRPFCVSRPGLALDERLILRLVEHDARRGADPGQKVDAVNAAVQRERDGQASERVYAAAEKLHWALKKDDA